jgi:hypothetical protein
MEQFTGVCKNPWCKATFFYTENDFVIVKNETHRANKINQVLGEEQKEAPKFCKKCQSFDKELSGGVTWKEKQYEGSRFDGLPHQIKYKVTNYRL